MFLSLFFDEFSLFTPAPSAVPEFPS